MTHRPARLATLLATAALAACQVHEQTARAARPHCEPELGSNFCSAGDANVTDSSRDPGVTNKTFGTPR